MKKLAYIYSFLLVFNLLYTGCNREDSGDQFSTLGASQDKQNIINAGLALFSETKGLSETSFATLGVHLSAYMTKEMSSHQNLVYSIALIGESMANETFVQSQFEDLMLLTTTSCGDLGILWNQGHGTWEWNNELSDFEQTSDLGDDITLFFPSEPGKEENNAFLRLYDFSTYDGDFPGKGDELDDGSTMTEILKSLYLEIKVDDKLVASSNIIIDFSDSGKIENLNLTFNPIPYSFQSEMSAKDNNAIWRYTLLNDFELIFEQVISGTYEETSDDNPLIKNLQSSTQIFNIKLMADVNSAQLLDDISIIETKEMESEKVATETAQLVNDNSTISLRYTNDAIIANGQAVARELNDDSNEWIVDVAFTFSDGSTEYITDLITYLYLFEDNLNLILKKTQNKLN
ncbi:hypothetical protein [Carboxylicivirga caseinilyticus]|uniref:hypothetical protein n=1 Tax=Carboxylicivirga caseinilyticus TaxID=3417572 RepID=UPI003D32877D|nr:hypothetical protein [Marinilabiliaceae bacterium A049]